MNNIDLTNRNAIVTGGARGIGAAIAQRLLQSGAQVALWDKDADALAAARKQLAAHGTVHTAAMDVTDAGSVEANLTGPFLCCRAVIPHLITNGYGRIVNIASIAGKEGNPTAAHYSASKAGVIALTKSLGKELATANVIANCITPAVIETDILKQVTQSHIDYMLSKIPMNRFGRLDEVAALAAWLCSADCSFTTGAVFDLSGGRATY